MTNESRRVRWEYIILACMYVGYMAFVHCRTAIQVSSPEMIADAGLGLTKTLFGQILAWGTAGMVAGKLCTGLIADRFGGRAVFLGALFAIALMTILMGFSTSYESFAAANFVMLFAGAAGWPAMAAIIAAWYPPKKFGKVWGIISTSSRLSSVLSMFVLGLLIASYSWKNIFQIAGSVGLVVVVLIFFFLKAEPADVGLTDTGTKDEAIPFNDKPHFLNGTTISQALLAFVKSIRFWMMCFSLMATTVMMEFIGFLPIYLRESFGVAASDAAKASSVFPAGCLIALLAGGFIYDKVSRKGRVALLGGMLATSSVCIAVLWWLPSFDMTTGAKLGIAIATLFFFGLTVAPSYYLPMSIFSIEFGGPHCGLLIGLIDATGYAASMVYQFTGGNMVDKWGWSSMLSLLFVTSLIAVLTTVWFAYEDFRAASLKVA